MHVQNVPISGSTLRKSERAARQPQHRVRDQRRDLPNSSSTDWTGRAKRDPSPCFKKPNTVTSLTIPDHPILSHSRSIDIFSPGPGPGMSSRIDYVHGIDPTSSPKWSGTRSSSSDSSSSTPFVRPGSRYPRADLGKMPVGSSFFAFHRRRTWTWRSSIDTRSGTGHMIVRSIYIVAHGLPICDLL